MYHIISGSLVAALLLGLLPALIVYIDAHNLQKKGYDVSASGWALAVFLMTIVCLPLYLSDRSRLLRQGLDRAVSDPASAAGSFSDG
jgi:hypothetical protein